MKDIYKRVSDTAKEYNSEGNLIVGANIAGFKKVAKSMIEQGAV
jgi:glutamate dehydrogenase (NADP+)